ncbi:receptor-type tyrosine-protein phosphatase eta isoform X2 [Dunckerocampus dactyliophorus]|uniref:receptor-type tyrosine-protein phosphatase eta isoform X2 n=1 Tax=Dunckerocampus dactyliophorus TaxID=161453 RepID=UPI002404EFC8|nr:receptor-type tyrosine-protein phosphatase eta isoform X2 [Dunckerocampus dactyliophorus]
MAVRKFKPAGAGFKASLWKHFGFHVVEGKNELDKSKTICKLCHTSLKYFGNTTNMKKTLFHSNKEEKQPAEVAADQRTIEGSHAHCNYKSCDSNETKPLITTTATTVTLASPPSCILSLGGISGNGSLSGLTPGAVYQIFLNCSSCCQEVTTNPREATNLTVINVTTSSITVSWTKPEGNCSSYVVHWTDGRVQQDENVIMTTKDITGLTAGTMYSIFVTAVADDGVTEGNNATVSQYTRPGIVHEHSVHTNTSSISLNWVLPDGEDFTYKVKWDNGGEQRITHTSDTYAVLSDLVSGTTYTITIVSVAGDNKTEGDPYTFTAVTKPAVVRNLRTPDVTTSSISLSWTDPDGNTTLYKLRWTSEGKTGSDNTSDTTFTIKDLIPGNRYDITVAAVAGNPPNTEGEETPISTFTRPQRPGNITATPGTDNLNIVWTLPQPGRADTYVVNISNKNLLYSSSNITTAKTAYFSGLYPGRVFLVTVTAVAGNQNNTSNHISLATIPTPPRSLHISHRTSSSLHLQWETPTSMEGAPLISYLIIYQTREGEMQTTNTSDDSAVLSQLTSGTLYNTEVKTVGPQRLMSSPVHRAGYTLPNPVLNLAARPLNTTSIKVAWSYPQEVKAEYTYCVQTYNAKGTLVKELKVSDNSTHVPDLEPGTRYNVSVTALAAAGSESTAEQTFTYTMPKAVTGLMVKDVNTTAITLKWLRPSDHKDSYSYLLTVFQDGTMLHNASTKTETYTFSGLTPGAPYSFEVFTVVEGVKSTEERTFSYTRPLAVSDISVIGTTTNMSVSWSAPTGQVDSYAVLFQTHSEVVSAKTDLSNATRSTLFVDLKAGVLYCALVISKSGPLESNSTSVCNATFPNPPGSISVASQTVHSINFTWALPDGMDQSQYNFSVSSVSGSSITTNNWFMLTNLQSGSQNSISVETMAALGYKSTAVTANNYTRPYSVTTLRAAEISTEAVTLVWEQPENKPDYSYVVHVTHELYNLPSEVVSSTLYNISGLLSGNMYTFAVSTQAADGTRAAPRVKSFFTRPFEITELEAHTINSTAIRLIWTKPPEHKPEYTYRVQTSGCGAHNKTVDDPVALISGLHPGTLCNFAVFVQAADGIEGTARHISQYTKPETVQPGISSQGSNMSVLVSWMSPPGNVEHYTVHLNASTVDSRQKLTPSTSNSVLFEGLSAGSLYSAMVMSFSGPFNASSQFVTNATFPNPPGPMEILTKTTHSIEVRWSEAPLMAEGSFYYQLTSTPSEGHGCVNTTNTSHTFEPLLSGTPYNISITTVGVMGFKSEKVHSSLVTTKPLRVKFLNTSEAEENITVMWTRPDEYKKGYVYNLTWQSSDWTMSGDSVTRQTVQTIQNLEPGSSYNFTVVSETPDGTQSAPTSISSCTDASPVRNAACEGPDKINAEIVLSWTKPRGRFHGFRITVNNTEMIIGTSTCNQSCSRTISNLSHSTTYQLVMETLSCGQPATPMSLHCKTGITDPPIPINDESLTSVDDKVHNRFTIQINSSLLLDTHGPITHFGVLVTDNIDGADTSNVSQYLGKTYQQWLDKETPVYLATVQRRKLLSRNTETIFFVDIGDGSQWEGYTNGALSANRRYQYAIVLFTRLSLQDSLVKAGLSGSLASITNFYPPVKLPQDPVVISVAVGATLGIFCVLFIILIGFIVYWKRLSSKESSDIQIHSMRSAAVSVEDYEAYYRKQKADSNCGFAEEFEDIKLVGTCQSKTNALTQENKAKNRYNNVLPYDSSRVKLSIIHGSPHDDYINANYMPGYNSRKEFIAAQGPLAGTVKDFWRMIWEKNVHTLVMLTRCNEQGRIKCEQYWHSGSKHFEYISVTTTSEIPLDDWTIRDFNIKNVRTAETRSVRQFHFTAWPDHGVPQTTELLISFRHLVREHMNQYSTNSPTVVHCSAGVGRTGTFIAIDRLIFQIEIDNVVDVYGVVHDLRMHRPLMVQTEDQYVFLNHCAMDIIRSRTGTNVDLIYQNTAALSIYENVEPKKGFYKYGCHDA